MEENYNSGHLNLTIVTLVYVEIDVIHSSKSIIIF